MYGGRVQYAIARAVYGQIRYAQGKPGGVPADIIGLGRHLSEIEGFYRALILKPSPQRTETIIIELNRAPMDEKAFKRQVDHLIHRWAQETIPAQANIIFDTASQSTIERLDVRQIAESTEVTEKTGPPSRTDINSEHPPRSQGHEPVAPLHRREEAAPFIRRGNVPPQVDKGVGAPEASALRVPPSAPGRAIHLTRNDVPEKSKARTGPTLLSDHLKILIEALELMSELESGRLEILTDLARSGRIPSALRLKQEDRIRCILKADELIRKAKMLLTGEGVGGKTALDYIQTSESAMRAQAIHALRHQILDGRIALEHQSGHSSTSTPRDQLPAPDLDAIIDLEKDLQESSMRRAGLLRPTRYTRSDVLRALENMHTPENG